MIEFAYPWLLLLLLLLPLIGVYCVYRQKQPSITVSTVAPFESVRAARRPGTLPAKSRLMSLYPCSAACSTPTALSSPSSTPTSIHGQASKAEPG